ncbi:MAG: DoxX family protein [Rhodospirillales bacterium]|nr:DoxX family protein [Rhodospirillales bacterium]MBO6785210.1 DoxX family protein [Rhodospirillales bacterium]
MSIVNVVTGLHDRFFTALENLAGGWFLGLAARLVFSSVLLVFFINSAMTKLGSGFPGMFVPAVGAYAQILPPVAEAAGYDPSQIALFPWKLIVLAGTCAELLLPIMLLIGLFTRLSALSLIGFIVVMSFVDIAFHGLDAQSIGFFFDRVQDAIIADQRLLWIFPLIYLVLKGGGPVSVDGLLNRSR